MSNEKETLVQKSIKIAGVVLLYWFVSITLVFINKTLLSDVDNTIDAPLFITWFQCCVSVILCMILRYTQHLCPGHVDFDDLQVKFSICRKVFPLSIMFVSMVSFNNLCLKFVDVPFYFIGRSLTTVFNVIMTYLFLGQKSSIPVLVSCGIVVSGFVIGVDQEGFEGGFSAVGIVYGTLSSFFVCLNSIFVKKTLPVVHDNIWMLTYYNNINAIAIFIPFIVINGEVKEILEFRNFHNQQFWAMMLIGGVFGFSIAYVSGLQIKVTSPLTHNISANAKAALQTVLACIWYHEVQTIMWWLSNVVLLFGSMLYSIVRQREMAKEMKTKKDIHDEKPTEQA